MCTDFSKRTKGQGFVRERLQYQDAGRPYKTHLSTDLKGLIRVLCRISVLQSQEV